MAYDARRYSSSFADIQRMAGALRIEAVAHEDAVSMAVGDGYSDAIRAAVCMGGAQALYALAPLIDEPDDGNIVAMVTGILGSIPPMADEDYDEGIDDECAR